jgi:Bardet-Biedl syndrome 2 protein
MVLAGGRSSIFGFDLSGSEVFWTVASDLVRSIAFTEREGEFLVGTEDYNITAYRNEELIETITEKAPVIEVLHMTPQHFACGLANGKIGYYHNSTNLWAIRGSRRAMSLLSFDATGDGVPDLIVAAKSLEVVSTTTGKSLIKRKLTCAAKLLSTDLRSDGSREILVCQENGKVLGLIPKRKEIGDLVQEEENAEHEEKLQAIANEAASYAEAAKKPKSSLISSESDVMMELQFIDGKSHLRLRSTNSAIIKLAILSSEALEGGGLTR